MASTHKIHHLLTKDQIERHFGNIKQPNVYDIFKGNQKKYPPRRASSACWDSPMSNRKICFSILQVGNLPFF